MLKAVEIQQTIRALYLKAETLGYIGEAISQLEHALQAGDLAVQAQAEPHVVIAAFLHDIGHLIESPDSQKITELGRTDHESAGAEFLKGLGFSDKICDLVKLHVMAKRYLVTKHENYFNKLSAASVQTLKLQGGKLNPLELQAYEQNIHFKDTLRIRAWDEEAKVVGKKNQGLDFYLNLIGKEFT